MTTDIANVGGRTVFPFVSVGEAVEAVPGFSDDSPPFFIEHPAEASAVLNGVVGTAYKASTHVASIYRKERKREKIDKYSE